MTEDEWKKLETAAFNDRDFLDTKCHVVTSQPTPTLNDTVMIVTTTGQCKDQKEKLVGDPL